MFLLGRAHSLFNYSVEMCGWVQSDALSVNLCQNNNALCSLILTIFG